MSEKIVLSVKLSLTRSFLLAGVLFLAHLPLLNSVQFYLYGIAVLFHWPSVVVSFGIGSLLEMILCPHTFNESPCCYVSFVELIYFTHWYSLSLFVLMGGVITEATGRQLYFSLLKAC